MGESSMYLLSSGCPHAVEGLPKPTMTSHVDPDVPGSHVHSRLLLSLSEHAPPLRHG